MPRTMWSGEFDRRGDVCRSSNVLEMIEWRETQHATRMPFAGTGGFTDATRWLGATPLVLRKMTHQRSILSPVLCCADKHHPAYEQKQQRPKQVRRKPQTRVA
jgi:hypothetical protein